MKQKPGNLNRAVRLFEADWKISEIAKKLEVTKQAVSSMLRDYYMGQDPVPEIAHIVTRVCKVCECEETSVVDRTPITELKQLRIKPIETTEKFICPMCKGMNLYRCTSCGSVGYLGMGVFLKTPINEENRRGRCLECNRTNVEVWRNKNKDKFRKIYSRYKSNMKKRRKEKGLCTECGKPNNTPEFSLCPKCREKYKVYKNRSKVNRQVLSGR